MGRTDHWLGKSMAILLVAQVWLLNARVVESSPGMAAVGACIRKEIVARTFEKSEECHTSVTKTWSFRPTY